MREHTHTAVKDWPTGTIAEEVRMIMRPELAEMHHCMRNTYRNTSHVLLRRYDVTEGPDMMLDSRSSALQIPGPSDSRI